MHVQNQGLTLFIAILWKTERVHSRALNTSNIALVQTGLNCTLDFEASVRGKEHI